MAYPKAGAVVGQISDKATELIDQANDLKEEVGRNVESAYKGLTKRIRRAEDVTKDKLDEGRFAIKRHPFAAVSLFAAAGFLIGLVSGLLVRSRKR